MVQFCIVANHITTLCNVSNWITTKCNVAFWLITFWNHCTANSTFKINLRTLIWLFRILFYSVHANCLFGSIPIKSCFVGIKVSDNCHQISYCRKQCIYNTTELNEEQVKIMKRKAGIKKLDTVSHHHLTIFFRQYESLQKTCGDPLKRHAKQVSSKFNNFLMNFLLILCINITSCHKAFSWN